MNNRNFIQLWIVGFLLFALVGCAGNFSGAGQSRSGNTTITFVWPERSRLIPIAANSIKLVISAGDISQSRIVSRTEASASQTSTIEFVGLLPGSYQVVAEAFPSTDATGTVQAKGSTSVVISAEQRSTFSITMLSEVTLLGVSGPSGLKVGQRASFGVTAFNAAGQIVLVDPSTVSWVVSSGVAELSAGSGQSTLGKAINSLGFTVRATYTEPSSNRPTADYAVPVEDALYESGSFFDTGRALNVRLKDVIGDGAIDRMMFLADDAKIAHVSPRETPGSETNLFTHPAGGATVIASSISSSGTTYHVFGNGGTCELYRGARGVTPTFAFNLPADTVDIAAADGGTIAVLYGSGTLGLRKYSSAGAATTLTGTIPSGANRVAADEDGNVYVNGSEIVRWQPDGTRVSLFTPTGTVLDLSAAQDNVYILRTDQFFGQANVEVFSSSGVLLHNISTFAFYEDGDLDLRMSVDPTTFDVYLGRSYEDFTFTNQAQVVSLMYR